MQRKRSYDPDTTLLTEDGERVPGNGGAAVKWARDAVEAGTAATVAVAMDIALRADESLVCWPRVGTIAKALKTSDKTVRRASHDLQAQRVIGVLYLWRGNEPSGCVWVINADGWLDDVLDDRDALLKRVVYVRREAIRLRLPVQALPAGTELSARKPANQHTVAAVAAVGLREANTVLA